MIGSSEMALLFESYNYAAASEGRNLSRNERSLAVYEPQLRMTSEKRKKCNTKPVNRIQKGNDKRPWG